MSCTVFLLSLFPIPFTIGTCPPPFIHTTYGFIHTRRAWQVSLSSVQRLVCSVNTGADTSEQTANPHVRRLEIDKSDVMGWSISKCIMSDCVNDLVSTCLLVNYPITLHLKERAGSILEVLLNIFMYCRVYTHIYIEHQFYILYLNYIHIIYIK